MGRKYSNKFSLQVFWSDMLGKEYEISRSIYYGEREELPKGVIPWGIAQ